MIHLYLHENGYDILGLARNFPKKLPKTLNLDVRSLAKLSSLLTESHFDIVVNCVGILNSAAARDKELAVFINSYLPHFLSKFSVKVIHLSTDCVFSGRTGRYVDDAPHDGETFYDRTKSLGELCNDKDLTLRQSIVGPELSNDGIGLLNWFLNQKGQIKGYTNAIWNGVTTLELAKVVKFSIEHQKSGLFQTACQPPVSKYELLCEFQRAFLRNSVSVEKYDNRPKLDKSLVSTRTDYGFSAAGYSTQMRELREWMAGHPDLYGHYNIN